MNTIGQPVSRVDSRLKVTGRVRYTADIPIEGLVHAAIVHSTIANGRTVSIDTTAAANAPGVVAVFTHSNMPRMNPTPRPWSHLHPHGQSYLPLQDDQIHYAGQPLALIVAHTLDQAIYAGRLMNVNYEVYPAIVFGPDTIKTLFSLRSSSGQSHLRSAIPKKESRQPTLRSSRPIRRPTAITIRWSRTQQSQSGTATAH